MVATKVSEAEREKVVAQLEAPFDPALIKWRVMCTFDNGRSGAILPFADSRDLFVGFFSANLAPSRSLQTYDVGCMQGNVACTLPARPRIPVLI